VTPHNLDRQPFQEFSRVVQALLSIKPQKVKEKMKDRVRKKQDKPTDRPPERDEP
jgi:hypothetical protein